ncbi:hypothetical protein LguiA_034043 [Lonicera macranthoides]
MDNCSDLTFGLVSTDDPTMPRGGLVEGRIWDVRHVSGSSLASCNSLGPNITHDERADKRVMEKMTGRERKTRKEDPRIESHTRAFCSCSCSLSRLAPHEAVQFDVDGTLCDSDPVHFDGLREMLQEIGSSDGAPITKEFYVEHFSGKHNTNIAAFGFPDDLEKGKIFMGDKEAMFRR